MKDHLMYIVVIDFIRSQIIVITLIAEGHLVIMEELCHQDITEVEEVLVVEELLQIDQGVQHM
jgi:hypothetical protein